MHSTNRTFFTVTIISSALTEDSASFSEWGGVMGGGGSPYISEGFVIIYFPTVAVTVSVV